MVKTDNSKIEKEVEKDYTKQIAEIKQECDELKSKQYATLDNEKSKAARLKLKE